MKKQNNLSEIHIKDLVSFPILGITKKERSKPQKVIINIFLKIDISNAIFSDNIKDTLDYKLVHKSISSFVENSKYFLLEKLTSEVVECCLFLKEVVSVTVIIEKPNILENSSGITVKITKEKYE